MRTLYLCGAGNPDAVRLALAVNKATPRWDRVELLDDDASLHGRVVLGVEIVGGLERLEAADPATSEVANLVARTTTRRWAVWRKIARYDLTPASLIDPAVDTLGATLPRELIVYENAHVGPMATVGEASVVFTGATVGHGSTVGECCVLAPGAVINARVRMGPGVYVGTNASILPEIRVGPWATIGAGSVAMADVPAGATVLGVPGKIVYLLGSKVLKMREAERLTVCNG